jgi:hypothetical protein
MKITAHFVAGPEWFLGDWGLTKIQWIVGGFV